MSSSAAEYLLIFYKDHEGKARFKNLVISDYSDTPAALESLLAWPEILEHFVFERIYYTEHHWSFGTFESILKRHQSTLKTLCIGQLFGRTTCINVTPFSNLEELNLSRWALDCTPDIAVSMLLGPKLKTFIWDFGIYDQHSESWSDFSQREQEWILEFARLTAARKSALKKIKIRFEPDEWSTPNTPGSYESVGFPWDRMDAVDVLIRPLGMILEYFPPPALSKFEVEQRIKEQAENAGLVGSDGPERGEVPPI